MVLWLWAGSANSHAGDSPVIKAQALHRAPGGVPEWPSTTCRCTAPDTALGTLKDPADEGSVTQRLEMVTDLTVTNVFSTLTLVSLLEFSPIISKL